MSFGFFTSHPPSAECMKSTNSHPERSRGATIQPDLRRLLRGESARKYFSHSLSRWARTNGRFYPPILMAGPRPTAFAFTTHCKFPIILFVSFLRSGAFPVGFLDGMGMGFILFFLQQFYTMNGSWNVINIILNAGASTIGFPPWKEGGKNHSPFRPSAV